MMMPAGQMMPRVKRYAPASAKSGPSRVSVSGKASPLEKAHKRAAVLAKGKRFGRGADGC